MVSLRGVESLFLHAYIAKNKLKPCDLNLSERGCIRNFSLIPKIHESYRQFLSSRQSVGDFFESQIVHFQASNNNNPFSTETVEVIQDPLILFSRRKGSSQVIYQTGISFDKVRLTTPIKMSLPHIFAIHGITDVFDTNNLEAMFELEDKHRINIHLYHLNDEMKGYRNSRIPGTRAIYHKDIYIGMRDNEFYWIKKNLTTKRYYCAKPDMIGKCCYWSTIKKNTERHEINCTDQTKIRADQVKY